MANVGLITFATEEGERGKKKKNIGSGKRIRIQEQRSRAIFEIKEGKMSLGEAEQGREPFYFQCVLKDQM